MFNNATQDTGIRQSHRPAFHPTTRQGEMMMNLETEMDVAQQIADTLTRTFVEAGMAGQKAKPALMAKQGARATYTLSLPIGELLDLMVLPDDQSKDEPTNRSITESWSARLSEDLGVKSLRARTRQSMCCSLLPPIWRKTSPRSGPSIPAINRRDLPTSGCWYFLSRRD